MSLATAPGDVFGTLPAILARAQIIKERKPCLT